MMGEGVWIGFSKLVRGMESDGYVPKQDENGSYL